MLLLQHTIKRLTFPNTYASLWIDLFSVVMALFLIGLWFQEMVAVVPWFWPLLCRAENFCLIKNTRKIKLSLSHSVSLSNSMNKFSLYKLWRLVHQSKYFIEYKCEWRALTILSLNLNWWPNSDIIFSSNMNFVSRSAHALKFQNLRFNDNVMLRDLL